MGTNIYPRVLFQALNPQRRQAITGKSGIREDGCLNEALNICRKYGPGEFTFI